MSSRFKKILFGAIAMKTSKNIRVGFMFLYQSICLHKSNPERLIGFSRNLIYQVVLKFGAILQFRLKSESGKGCYRDAFLRMRLTKKSQ
jgi:hypothetical protein